MKIRLILISVLFMSYAQATTKKVLGPWSGFSAPEIMASGFTNSFKALPLEAKLSNGTKGWSSSYWPSREGGINVRWNSVAKVGFDYASPTFEEVKKMSLEQLSTLSPTEKYDLFTGQYGYPMKKLAATAASRRAPEWAGICHGWAPAATHHNEPTPKVMTNPDGIKIPFGSADIKALVSYYYAFHYESERSYQLGLRCFFGSWMGGTRACSQDLNAGAFHIVIANMIGLQNKGFMIDIDRYKEVWNQPVSGYKSKILQDNLPVSAGAAKSAVKEMKIATDFYYVDESKGLYWEVVKGTEEQIISTKNYIYSLEIDANGQIVGGSWESDERPDFLWNKEKAPGFEGILSGLTQLMND